MTKKEIINILDENSIQYNSKMNKSELEALIPVSKEEVNNLEDNELIECDKYVAKYISKGKLFTLGTYATDKDANYYLDKVGAHIRTVDHVTVH